MTPSFEPPALTAATPRRPTFGLVFAGSVMGVLVLTALLGLFWTPFDPNAQDFAAQLLAPGPPHWLGTDTLGRDLLSRLLRGASTTLMAGIIAMGAGALLGAPLGAVAAYRGGAADDAIMRVLEALSALPTVLLALLFATVFRPGLVGAMLAVGLSSIPAFARVSRGGVLAQKERAFIESARALGASGWRVLARHIAPNILPAFIVQASLAFANAVLAEAALSYLGLGVQPPDPSWGRMLRDAQDAIYQSAWPAVLPGALIMVTVLALNLLGDAVRDLYSRDR